MPRLRGRLPKYRLHRASGQAIVTLSGRDHYLGPHDSPQSYALYDRLIGQWLSAGRRDIGPGAKPEDTRLTVDYLILAFWGHAESYYRRPDGSPTTELDNFRQSLRPLRRLYGPTPAAEFSPRALKALRQHMIERGWCRTNINKHIHRIIHVFRWAAGEEMLPVDIHRQLKAVDPLKRGRTSAVESEPRGLIPADHIEAVRPHVSAQVWAMIQLQLCTGARPGEILKLRPADIQRDGDVWVCELGDHKTAHHGHARRLYFGPRARKILEPYLEGRDADACLFSPSEAEGDRRAHAHAARRTPHHHGNRPGTNRRAQPRRHPGDHYTLAAYRRAIHRACDLAYPPPDELARRRTADGRRWETDREWRQRLGPDAWAKLTAWQREHRWSPHRLRKNAATEIRRQYGVEMSKIILGHRSIAVNEIYAERDEQQAMAVMDQLG